VVLSPFYQLRYLVPPGNHWLWIQQNHYVPLASILFVLEGSWQTRTSRLSNSSFKSIVIWLPKHKISVLPLIKPFDEVSRLILKNMLFKIDIIVHLWLIIFVFFVFTFLVWLWLLLLGFLWLRLWRYYLLLSFTLVIWSRHYLPEVIVLDAKSWQFGHVVGSR